ncbi:hypothetical protein B0H14DRAFT_173674 [Mycena olivaceomarginata]|nr:hypothetical protein B0H14DRAFT_173674 [Mycena olivaceomarginata]
MRSPFSLWTSCIFAWTLLSVLSILTESKPLVPYKHTPRVLPRSTWKREIVPQDIVTLSYAPEGAHRPTSSLTFSAYENVPVLALEDIEFLIETVVCDITLDEEDAMVEIVFASEDAYAIGGGHLVVLIEVHPSYIALDLQPERPTGGLDGFLCRRRRLQKRDLSGSFCHATAYDWILVPYIPCFR